MLKTTQAYSSIEPKSFEYFKKVCQKASRVVGWWAHSEDNTIRGPFGRWFTCSEIPLEYKKYMSDISDDVEYASTAMNAFPHLLNHIETLEREIARLKNMIYIK